MLKDWLVTWKNEANILAIYMFVLIKQLTEENNFVTLFFLNVIKWHESISKDIINQLF